MAPNRKHSLTNKSMPNPKRLATLPKTPDTSAKAVSVAGSGAMRQILVEKKDWYDFLCLPDGRVAVMSGIPEPSRLNSFQELHLEVLSVDEKTQKARVDASLKLGREIPNFIFDSVNKNFVTSRETSSGDIRPTCQIWNGQGKAAQYTRYLEECDGVGYGMLTFRPFSSGAHTILDHCEHIVCLDAQLKNVAMISRRHPRRHNNVVVCEADTILVADGVSIRIWNPEKKEIKTLWHGGSSYGRALTLAGAPGRKILGLLCDDSYSTSLHYWQLSKDQLTLKQSLRMYPTEYNMSLLQSNFLSVEIYGRHYVAFLVTDPDHYKHYRLNILRVDPDALVWVQDSSLGEIKFTVSVPILLRLSPDKEGLFITVCEEQRFRYVEIPEFIAHSHKKSAPSPSYHKEINQRVEKAIRDASLKRDEINQSIKKAIQLNNDANPKRLADSSKTPDTSAQKLTIAQLLAASEKQPSTALTRRGAMQDILEKSSDWKKVLYLSDGRMAVQDETGIKVISVDQKRQCRVTASLDFKGHDIRDFLYDKVSKNIVIHVAFYGDDHRCLVWDGQAKKAQIERELDTWSVRLLLGVYNAAMQVIVEYGRKIQIWDAKLQDVGATSREYYHGSYNTVASSEGTLLIADGPSIKIWDRKEQQLKMGWQCDQYGVDTLRVHAFPQGKVVVRDNRGSLYYFHLNNNTLSLKHTCKIYPDAGF